MWLTMVQILWLKTRNWFFTEQLNRIMILFYGMGCVTPLGSWGPQIGLSSGNVLVTWMCLYVSHAYDGRTPSTDNSFIWFWCMDIIVCDVDPLYFKILFQNTLFLHHWSLLGQLLNPSYFAPDLKMLFSFILILYCFYLHRIFFEYYYFLLFAS